VSLPTTLLSSSVVERSAVNRLVVGSNPTSGAILSGFLRSPFLQTSVEGIDRAKGQLSRRVYIGDGRLQLQKILPGSLFVRLGICFLTHAGDDSRLRRTAQRFDILAASNIDREGGIAQLPPISGKGRPPNDQHLNPVSLRAPASKTHRSRSTRVQRSGRSTPRSGMGKDQLLRTCQDR
jgi:hypothetical protein